MTGQDLKNSILQLAIQGKLVTQDANDEPASVLLERIKAEKQKLIKEKKIKKEKPLPEITDEEKPFEIPESWEWCRWGDLSFSIQYGYNASAQQNGDIRMVRISDIQNNEVLWETVPYCKIKSEDIEGYMLKANDILFARTGGTVGKSFLVKNVPYPSIYAGYLIRTRYSNELVPQYLKFFMESSLYWEQLKKGTIATAQPNCNGKTLGNMVLPLPPLSEQHRIVAKIEELMPLVEEYDKAQKELDALNVKLPEALKKSILQEAIQGKLVPQDPNDEPASVLLQRIRKEKEQLVKDGKLKKKDLVTTPISDEEKPFEIPESWEWCRLGEISTYSATKSKVNASKAPLDTWGLDLEDIEKGGRLLVKKSVGERKAIGDKTLFKKGNILYSKLRPYLLKILVAPDDGICTPEIVPFDVFCNISRHYIVNVLKSTYVDDYINSVTFGIKMPRVSTETMTELLIPLPPLAEQHRIVSKIEDLFAQIEPLAKALSTPM